MNPKSPFKSLTLWGLVPIFLPAVLRRFGVDLEPEQVTGAVTAIREALPEISQAAGAIMVVWGRIRAKRPLALLPSDSKLPILLLFLTMPLSSCAILDGGGISLPVGNPPVGLASARTTPVEVILDVELFEAVGSDRIKLELGERRATLRIAKQAAVVPAK